MKTIYTLTETSEHNLGDWDFRFESNFQDAVDHWVNEGEDREEMQVAVKKCLKSFNLDNEEDTGKVLNSVALLVTSDIDVLREIMKAAIFHKLPLYQIDKCIITHLPKEDNAVEKE